MSSTPNVKPPVAARPVSPLVAMAQRQGQGQPGQGGHGQASRPSSVEAGGRRGGFSGPVVEHVGVVDSIKIFGDWAVGTIRTEEAGYIKVTGAALKDLKEGLEYKFTGAMRSNAKYGESLDVEVCTPHIQPSAQAIAKFLAGNFEGIGARTAAKFVDRVKTEEGEAGLESLRLKLLTEPWSVDFSSVGKQGAYSSEQRDATIAAHIQRNLATRLGAIEGMRGGVLKSLAHYLAKSIGGPAGAAQESPANPAASRRAAAAATTAAAALPPDPVEASWACLARDPYEPIEVVPGYGFAMADAIGKSVNIKRDDPARLAALVAHAQREHCEGYGHTFLTLEQLHQSIGKLDPRVDVDSAVAVSIERGKIERDDAGGKIGADGEPIERYYRPSLLDAERCLARRVAALLDPSDPLVPGAKRTGAGAQVLTDRIQAAARAASPAFAKGMDPSQVQALANILTSSVRLHTLTAGPGCGKTALMEVLIKLLPGKSFHFCAPTGKAAKVLTSRVRNHGHSAGTIHSLLQGSGRGSFKMNQDNPLDGDVLVIDESTMPDVTLAESVLAAANGGMHVIFLGDVRQLPSIQPGRVLADLLHLPQADHNHLTVTHRNSGGILDVVNEVAEGAISCTDRESVTFSHGLEEAREGFRDVMGTYVAAVNRRGIENVILMMSRRQGKVDEAGWNTTYANEVLRNVCNPGAPKVPGTSFNVGDRIIIRDNMTVEQPPNPRTPDRDPPSVRVVNGDTGTIKGYVNDDKNLRNGAARWLDITLDDGRAFKLPGAMSGVLGLSYALTVHAGQGSEYQEVIVVATPGQPTFINRNMLFTGLSRARTHLHIFGDDQVLRRIAATPLPERNSALVERVLDELSGEGEQMSLRTASRDAEPQRRAG